MAWVQLYVRYESVIKELNKITISKMNVPVLVTPTFLLFILFQLNKIPFDTITG